MGYNIGMNKVILIIVGIAVVLVGGYFLVFKGAYQPTPSVSEPNQQPTSEPSAKEPSEEQQPVYKIVSFTVIGNDFAGSPTTLNVKKGDTVQITFKVQTEGTYYGGLDFRSSVINTGKIVPGSSKTITFTAIDSLTFTPYWPSANIKKPYTINVVVE